MATEDNLWIWLKRARDTFGSALHMRRVENLAETGGPDVEFCYSGMGGDLELKACSRPRGHDARLRYHEVTVQQVEWHEKRLAAGGATGFLIQVGEAHEAVRYLVHGRYAAVLATGVTEAWLKAKALPVAKASYAIQEALRLVN